MVYYARFLHHYIDSEEIDFIISEFEQCILEHHWDFLSPFEEKKMYFSLKKRKSYLELRANELGYDADFNFKRDDFGNLRIEKVKFSSQNSLKTDEPQQNQESETDAVENKHINIFRNNGFDVWQSMFDSFCIDETSRTDVKFMYEIMKKDGLIFDTINQKTFLDWISKTYEIVIQKTSNHSVTNERIAIYSIAKQLFKN
ncbi:hypothetical protein [Cellulophaga sp. Hel_I_12]|uniref:hypothetical protein n=1 Tax=Cellulophaga sp. Hel_I_12 TaxID=1249972 RepID=UPI000646E73D|nr:hypothetical protein [Cellulophaga sp. Hel_I_12]